MYERTIHAFNAEFRAFGPAFVLYSLTVRLAVCLGGEWCLSIGLEVTSGSSFCQIDANCATDGAGAHGNNEACTIRVGAAGTLTATEFHTESCCDYVNISDILYRGNTGPNGVAVAAGSTFAWGSDGSVTNAGWTICLGKMRCCDVT